jgi:hypothetical protein
MRRPLQAFTKLLQAALDALAGRGYLSRFPALSLSKPLFTLLQQFSVAASSCFLRHSVNDSRRI